MIALLLTAFVATTPITLEQVREQSRMNTQALLAGLEAARAGLNVRSARSGIFPQIALNGGAGAAYRGPQRQFGTFPQQGADGSLVFLPGTRDIPAATNGSFDLSLSVNQLIYDGGKWWKRIEQAGAQQEAARGQFEEQQLVSEFEGVRRFFELYRAQRQYAVLEANERRSQDQVARAEGLFQSGRVGKNESLAAKVNLGNDRISLLRQRSRIATTQADLAAWIARPASEGFEAIDPPLGTGGALLAMNDALQTAKRTRPLYRSLDAQVRAAMAAHDIVRGDYLPRVSAQVTGGRQGPTANPFFTDPTQQNFVSAGINLRWDIFNGFVTDAQSGVALSQQRTAELNLKQALLELEAELQRATFSVDVQQQATSIARSNAELAAESLKVAEGRFSQGASSTLEVRDAQLKLTQAELLLLETQIDVEIARANLERVLGGRTNGVNP